MSNRPKRKAAFMWRSSLIPTLFALGGISLQATAGQANIPVPANQVNEPEAVGIIVKAKQQVGVKSVNADQNMEKLLKKHGLKVKKSFKTVGQLKSLEYDQGPSVKSTNPNQAAVVIDKEKIKNTIAELKATGEFEYVEPNWKLHALATTTDTYFNDGTLWGINNTGANSGTAGVDLNIKPAWDLTMGSSEVIVCVVDTGIRYTHQELASSMWVNPGEIPGNGIDDDGNGYIDDVHGINAITNSGDPIDDQDHGTHCAGTIAAKANGGGPHVGVAPNIKLMAGKFLDSTGGGSTEGAIECIEYAIAKGAHILSNSYGGGGYSQALNDVIIAANKKGILFVAAAGNDGTNNDYLDHFPSNYPVDNVLSVAAMDRNGNLATFSNFGAEKVHIAAPGVAIMSTVSGSDAMYASFSGTSMACPHVAGVAALIKSYHPEANAYEIKRRIMQTSRKFNGLAGKVIAGGIPDIYAAMTISQDGNMEVVAKVIGADTVGGMTGPIAIEVSDLNPVLDARVSANFPDQSPVDFFDNGVTPDLVAGDGIYTANIAIPDQASAALHIRAIAPNKVNYEQDFALVIPRPPANDNFANRIALDPTSYSVSSTTSRSTLEPGEPTYYKSGNHSVWYTWRASTTGVATFGLYAIGNDPSIAIYTGTSLDNLTLVQADHDIYWGNVIITPTLNAGTTYIIRVSGVDDGQGPFTLSYPQTGAVPGAPVFTNHPQKQRLTIGDRLSLTSTVVGDEPITFKWYKDGVEIANTNSKDYSVAVVDTSDQGEYKVQATNAKGTSMSMPAYVTVERIATPPANDLFSKAELLSGASGSVTGRNDRATGEALEPNHAGTSLDAENQLQSVWYTWVAPSYGTVSINTLGSSFDATLAAYKGNSISSLALLKEDDNGAGQNQAAVTFAVQAGVVYRIAVDGAAGAKGDIRLNWEFTSDGSGPANDLFANRIPLYGNVTTVGSNVGSSAEMNEPPHAGDMNGAIHSVWWTWTAPSYGTATIDLAGSNFDTICGVYTGDAVEQLVPVASNDNNGTSKQSKVTFYTTPGTRYQIAVDGAGAVQGGINMAISYVANAGQPGKVLLIDNGRYGFGRTAEVLTRAGYNVTEMVGEIDRGFSRIGDLNVLKAYDLVVYNERGLNGQTQALPAATAAVLKTAYESTGVKIILTGHNCLVDDPEMVKLVTADVMFNAQDQQVFSAGELNSQEPLTVVTSQADVISNGPFGDYRNSKFELTPQDDDLLLSDSFSPTPIVYTGSPTKTTKLLYLHGVSSFNGKFGKLYFWNGGGVDGTPAQVDFCDGKQGEALFLNLVASVAGYVAPTNNQAPIARVGYDITVTDTDGDGWVMVDLDGSASTDPDGHILGYTWKYNSLDPLYMPYMIQTTSGSKSQVKMWVGSRPVSLTVTDDRGVSTSAWLNVTVLPSTGNQPPVANAGPDLVVTDADGNGTEAVTLTDASSDADGTIASYSWRFGNNNYAGPVQTLNFPTGTSQVTLTVTDNAGAKSTDILLVTVKPKPAANLSPIANAGSSISVIDVDGNGSQAVTLNGSASSDPDGTIASYDWKWPTGTATGINPTVTLPVGSTTVQLTVKDNLGASATSSVLVVVNSPSTTITGISPSHAPSGASVTISMTGTYLATGCTAKLVKAGAPDIEGTSTVVASATAMSASFNLSAAVTGVWDMVVTNNAGQKAILASSFTITSAPMLVTKSAYATTDAISIDYLNAPGLANQWIGIYQAGQTPGTNAPTQSSVVTGSNGTKVFNAITTVGDYVAYLFRDGGNTIVAQCAFSVQPMPTLASISPSSGVVGTSVTINMTGSNFVTGCTAKLVKAGSADVTGSSVVITSATAMSASFNLTGIATGTWDVVVSNGAGQSSTLVGGFVVNAPLPTLLSMSPNNGVSGVMVATSIAGTNFTTGCTAKLVKSGSADIVGTSVTISSATSMNATFTLTNAIAGTWDLVVTNSTNQSATLVGAFTVGASTMPLPKHWYKMDETTGTIANDSSGNSMHATVTGAPVWEPTGGKFGGSLKFKGTTDCIRKATTLVPVGSFTVSVWAKSAGSQATTASSVFSNTMTNTAGTFQIDVSNGYNYTGTVNGSFGPVVVGSWVHLVAVCNGISTDLYYNGTYVRTLAVADTNFNGVSIAVNRNGLRTFNGSIDDVRVYASALTSTQIAAIYSGTDAGGSTTGTTFASWQSSAFTPTEISSGIGAPTGDYDQDGLSNLLEYAIDSDPKVANSLGSVKKDATGVWFEFNRPQGGRSDINYTAEASSNMVNWTPAILEISATGSPEKMRVRDPLTTGDTSKRFIRLKVSPK